MRKNILKALPHRIILVFITVLFLGSPEAVQAEETIQTLDVLGELLDSSRLFYNGAFTDKFVTNTEPYLEIHSKGDSSSEVIGKLYPVSCGHVEEFGHEWTKISSGNITGYVTTKDIFTGYDAEQLAKAVGSLKATIHAESVNIRQNADINSPIVGAGFQNESFDLIESDDEWTCIAYGDGEAYVATPYITENYELTEARSTADEITGSLSSAFSVPDDEAYLLACMVYVEAGAESYEGQLAVANVILNRVRDPRFDNTITEVIYADGQFPGAHNGVLDNVIQNGPGESSIKAAQEALAGVNNIGDYYFFNGYVDTSSVSTYTVIGGHTFYNY